MMAYSMAEDDLNITADNVKKMVMMALVKEGVLTEDVADEWAATHAVILARKSIWRTISSLWDKEEKIDGLYWRVVKGVI